MFDKEKILIDNKDYYRASNCAKLLGYKNPSVSVKKHCKITKMNFISKKELDKLIKECTLPETEELKNWRNKDKIEISVGEIQFGNILDGITGFVWEKQYPIDDGKFRLDFKLKDILIVEYDEKHHKYQKEDDEKRINYCINWLAENETNGYKMPYIRVNEGEEFIGLNKIIKLLAKKGVFTQTKNKKNIFKKFIDLLRGIKG
jgi:very-short-patch-repair endonuclease